MSMSALLTTCIGLYFLCITSSASLAFQHPVLLSESPNVKDVEQYDSTQNLRLMNGSQEEYVEKESNGGGNQMGNQTLTEGKIQKRQAQPEENGIRGGTESEENSSENVISNRIALMRRNADEIGFKSRPGFRSWGGKRSKFTNWGGKRNTFSRWGGKRSKFNNWGGKRSENAGVNLYDLEMSKIFAEAPDIVHSEERIYGLEKRDPEYPLPYEQEGDPMEKYLDQDFLKKDEFQTWAGKRAEKPMSPIVDFNKFSKWAGKRKFSNWAGKRGNIFTEIPEGTSTNWILRSYLDSILNMMKNKESGGKRTASESKPFRDEAENEKTKVYSMQDTR